MSRPALIGDIGGTNARFALVTRESSIFRPFERFLVRIIQHSPKRFAPTSTRWVRKYPAKPASPSPAPYTTMKSA